MPRPNGHSGKTIIYVPFPEINSTSHIQSSVGGFIPSTIETIATTVLSSGVTPPDSVMNDDTIRSAWKMQGWKKVQPEDIVCSDSTTRDHKLSALTNEHDMIYIRAHCEKGSRFIESGDHNIKISYNDLVTHFVNRLPTNFPGSLKLFCCESALGAGFSFWQKNSFGAEFKKAMVARGYTSCRYYGYTTEVGTWTSRVGGYKTGLSENIRASTIRVPL